MITSKQKEEHGLSVGDILCTSWGYDCTRAYFYQVTRIPSGKSAYICKIQNKMNGNWATPVRDSFCGGEELHRTRKKGVLKSGESFIPDFKIWEGKPEYCSDY